MASAAGSDRFSRGGNVPGDAQIESLRLPPHSVEAEQAVLGGLLLSNSAWDRIGDVVSESDFYRADHRLLWRIIVRLIEDNKPADVLTVSEALKTSGEISDVGGLAYLHQLASGTPSAANIRRYAEIVRERSIMRMLAEVGTSIADSAYSPQGREARQLLDEAETRILEIGESGGRSSENFAEMSKVLAEVMSRLDELHRNPAAVTGKATGYTDLDEMTTGLQDGDLIIIAGRPSMGKSQPLDARIKTLRGWKRMGDLEIGDALASIDGAPSIVTGLFPQGERQVYRITFSDGRSTECCAEHLWRVHYRSWPEPRVLETKSIVEMLTRKRYQHRLWIDQVSGDFGHMHPLPIDPWVLGALIGDGSLGGGSPMFCTAADEMLERMRERVGVGMELSQSSRYDWRLINERPIGLNRLSGRGNPVTQALRFLGLWELQGHEKYIPRIYLEAKRSARLALLQGLLDTDGWVETFKAVRYCTTSPQLAKDVAELVRSLGGWCTTNSKRTTFTHKGEKRQGRTAYVLNIHHHDPRSLFLLSDKQSRLPERYERSSKPVIVSVHPTRVTATQCISVSHPSKLYVTDDYVVTHNTSLALNIAEHVGLELKLPVLIFSMEMGSAQLALRLLGSVGKVDAQKLRTGRLDPGDWDRLGAALGKLNEAPILIDETAALNPLELRARARRKWREYGGLGLIVVDYIQLMQASDAGTENRATELSEISRGLKAMAKELACPVIALSQLNRSLEQRPNKRPVMSDLRECVTGETLVNLADGRRVPIRELVGTMPEVLSIDEDGKVIKASSDCVWSVGVKPVFKVSLASGRTIRATAKHRLFGATGWVEVGNLQPGTRLALARHVPAPAQPVRWPDHELVLLGQLVGDGSFLVNQPLRYTTASEANSEAVRISAQAMGATVKRYAGRGLWHQLLITGNGDRWHAAGVGKWLKDLGIFGQRSHEKRL
ncbi:MAG TPA: replicative DNA helicase, partial [Anaeromyxobacteraceae bacterium]|nr:replicative DNA helicase [Anaeromyxobacteraceae bacterium]